MPRRAPSPDWRFVGAPYKALHPIVDPLNRFLGRARVSGIEHVPLEGGAILASTHLSNWDPLLVCAAIPRPVNWMGQELVLRGTRARRWFFREAGVIPVDRTKGGNEAAVAEAIRRVEEGRIVGVFPEGKESPDPLKTLPPRSGVARIALATGAPIVPCAVRPERFWPYAKWPRPFRGPNFVRYGPAFRVPRDAAAAHDPERARLWAEEIWDRVLAVKKEVDAIADA